MAVRSAVRFEFTAVSISDHGTGCLCPRTYRSATPVLVRCTVDNVHAGTDMCSRAPFCRMCHAELCGCSQQRPSVGAIASRSGRKASCASAVHARDGALGCGRCERWRLGLQPLRGSLGLVVQVVRRQLEPAARAAVVLHMQRRQRQRWVRLGATTAVLVGATRDSSPWRARGGCTRSGSSAGRAAGPLSDPACSRCSAARSCRPYITGVPRERPPPAAGLLRASTLAAPPVPATAWWVSGPAESSLHAWLWRTARNRTSSLGSVSCSWEASGPSKDSCRSVRQSVSRANSIRNSLSSPDRSTSTPARLGDSMSGGEPLSSYPAHALPSVRSSSKERSCNVLLNVSSGPGSCSKSPISSKYVAMPPRPSLTRDTAATVRRTSEIVRAAPPRCDAPYLQ